MNPIPNAVIQEVFDNGKVYDGSGQSYPVQCHIHQAYATALYRTILKYQPKVVVEIGMAYGISSLAILTALRESKNDGRLISIDPHQNSQWKGVGVANVERCGMSKQHQLLEMYDYVALPHLVNDNLKIEFAYIDGWHTFDYTLLDFFFLDKMLHPGGIVGFNDCSMRAVHKVLKFVRTHRKYKELDIGLKRSYRGRNALATALRRFSGRSHADRYFQKRQNWEPGWDFYVPF